MQLKPYQIQTTDSALEALACTLQDLVASGDLTITQTGLDNILTAISDPYHEDSESLLDVKYQEGYRKGYSDQDWNPQSNYDDGYNEGYNDAELEAEQKIEDAYQDGYEKGKAETKTNPAEAWASYYNGYNDATKKAIPKPIASYLEQAGFAQVRATTYERDGFTISFTQNFHRYTLRSKDGVVFTHQSQKYHEIER